MKGAYCLLVDVKKDTLVEVGSLGTIEFEKGKYVYVGSGMNSLEKRLERHFRRKKKKHWHIDYLLGCGPARPEGAWVKPSQKKEECEIAGMFAKTGEPIKGFGCSDCRCNSHLFKLKEPDISGKMEGFEWVKRGNPE